MARRTAFARQAEFEAKLAQQPAKMREEIVRVNDRIAMEHVARLMAVVPKGSPYRGHIQSSIRVLTLDGGLTKKIRIGNVGFKYAAPLEFGHRNRDGSRTPATPFFFPLARLMRRKHRPALRRIVRKVLSGK